MIFQSESFTWVRGRKSQLGVLTMCLIIRFVKEMLFGWSEACYPGAHGTEYEAFNSEERTL